MLKPDPVRGHVQPEKGRGRMQPQVHRQISTSTHARTDKDRPSTWIPYRQGYCAQCNASCCTMPVEVKLEDLIRLKVVTEDEALGSRRKMIKRLQKAGIVSTYREGTDLYQMQSRPNGDCQFLHPTTRLCQVYDQRPGVCREFPAIGPRPGFCPKNPKPREK